MDKERFIIGKSIFQDQTTIHPIGLTVLVLLGIVMLFVPRRRAMIAILACASFIAVGQRIVVFSLDFNYLRIMILFGWARILIHQEFRGFRLNRLDYCIVAWAFTATVMYVATRGASSIVYKLGTSFDSVGMYFLVRMLVRDLDDVRGMVETMALISVPVACVFFVEYCTRRNLFAVLGGVPEITLIREGKLRCQGAYAHPILAGCFWAAIIPLLVGRAWSPGVGRYTSAIGLMAALAIIFMCSSSTPVVGVLVGIMGLSLIRFRRTIRLLRWTAVIVLTCMHVTMDKPVWHLLARTDLIGGSTGFHRYFVIDQFVRHFSEWVVAGRANINHWNIFANDITNQYVLEGIRGGLLALIMFLTVIGVAFGNVGRLWRAVEHSPAQLVLAWVIGVSVLVHTVNFLGVSYFGQIDMLWYMGLALTTVAPPPRPRIPAGYRMSTERRLPVYRPITARNPQVAVAAN